MGPHTRICNFVRHISTNISTLGERTHLGNCLLYLSFTISQFLDFIQRTVFDFIFYCVTLHTLYWQLDSAQLQKVMYFQGSRRITSD